MELVTKMNNVEKNVFDSNIIYEVVRHFFETYETAEKREVYKENRSEMQGSLSLYLPDNALSIEAIADNVFKMIRGNECNVLSPKYYGYITPKPLPISIVGDWISMIGNQTPGAWRAGPAATMIENLVIKWLAQFVEYKYKNCENPPGIITSGGSASNLTGIQLGRNECLNNGATLASIRYYISEAAHLSIHRSLNVLGASKENICIIPVLGNQCMDINALETQIKQDIADGFMPAVIVATYGTTTVGAIDNVNEISKLAKLYGIWFHIDAASGGAYGGIKGYIERYGSLNCGDSVTLDPSKWLFSSYGVSCLLIHDSEKLVKLYGTESNYWEVKEEQDNFQMSFSCTRQWRSLGIYMSFSQLGKNGYYEILNKLSSIMDVLQNELIKAGCQVLRGSKLPILVFSFPGSNDEKVLKFVEDARIGNIGYLTTATIMETCFVRVAVSNYDTRLRDIFCLVEYTKKFIERYN